MEILKMADIFDTVAQGSEQTQAPTQAQPSQSAQGKTQGGDIFDQVATHGTPNVPSLNSAPTKSAQQGVLDTEIPLTSYGNATLSGLQSIGRGVRSAVQGTADLFSAPKDGTEKTINAISPVALPLYRTLRGAGHSVKDAAQITGAIHDINASADPLGAYAKAAQETAGEGVGQALTALAAEGIIKGVPAAKGAAENINSAIGPKTISPKVIQEPLKAGIKSAVEDVADDAGVPKPMSKSIRNVVEETADKVYDKSKAQYQALDEATGGRFQRFKEKLEAGRKQLMNLSGSEEDVAKEASILKGQQETEAAMQEAFDEARAKGIDPKLIDDANANFKRSQALYDLDIAIKKSTEGAHPELSSPELVDDSPETVNPQKLSNRINSLYDSGRLQDALGEMGANDLFDHSLKNLSDYKKIMRNRQVAATAGKYAAGALGLGAAGHYVGHLLD
jgi:hypothetical protein